MVNHRFLKAGLLFLTGLLLLAPQGICEERASLARFVTALDGPLSASLVPSYLGRSCASGPSSSPSPHPSLQPMRGWWHTEAIEESFEIESHNKNPRELNEAISKVCRSRSPDIQDELEEESYTSTRQEWARQIAQVANCFQVSPLILLGIFERESECSPDTCYIGGCGGFGISSAGMNEVNEQIGMATHPKKALAQDETIRYLNEKLDTCIQSDWRERLYTESLLDFRGNFFRSLVYSAILLKTYLAVEKHSQIRKHATCGKGYLTCYRNALSRYNSTDPHYSKKVFTDFEKAFQ